MEADFKDAVIHSDDIAYFAPSLKDWNKDLRIRGRASGSVDNLSARNVVIEAGKDSYLTGSLSLKGLPDIEQTYIDFTATDFRTTYPDAVTLTRYKDIDQPRLQELGYLKFKGFLQASSVTFNLWNHSTKLGTVLSDVNMKLPEIGPSSFRQHTNRRFLILAAL